MNLRIPLIMASAALIAGSCSTTPGQEARTPKAEQRLAEAIEGRVAGPPVDCMPNYRSATQMQIIDDNTLVFHDGNTVYVQNPPGGCRGLGIGGYTLVTREFGSSQMCRGDINNLVDIRNGMIGGSCVFGPFIPYRKAG
jgi:hypothetical protein